MIGELTRRDWMKLAGASGLGALAGMCAEAAEARSGFVQPGKLTKVIDCHAHLNHRSRATWEADDRKLIEAADKLGIDLAP